MITLNVDLGARSYPVLIGTGLLAQAEHYPPAVSRGRCLIVTNDVVAPLYLARVQQALGADRHEALVLADGEAHKTLDTANHIYDRLLQARFGRDCALVALGGGVIGDLTGFAAATYQRGVDFIQIPTTLLAQVDSSVGGKTGVNHPLGKNMIGAFHQPRAVIADTDCLKTLPAREFAAGLAEVIKYGLLGDAPFFDWLEQNMDALLQHGDKFLAEAIRRSCANKARIVALDERESGPRALLNLGHSFGHAIETTLGYGVWLHGEAVAAGICMAADLSRRLGWLTPTEQNRIVRLMERAGLPTRLPPHVSAQQLLEAMALDKKVTAGHLRLVLLKGIGGAVVTKDFSAAQLNATLAHYCREGKA